MNSRVRSFLRAWLPGRTPLHNSSSDGSVTIERTDIEIILKRTLKKNTTL